MCNAIRDVVVRYARASGVRIIQKVVLLFSILMLFGMLLLE